MRTSLHMVELLNSTGPKLDGKRDTIQVRQAKHLPLPSTGSQLGDGCGFIMACAPFPNFLRCLGPDFWSMCYLPRKLVNWIAVQS